MLLRRDGPGDREKALSLLSQALDVAERLGLTALLERSLALKMKAQGIDLTDIGSSIDTVAREALAEQPDLKPHAAPDGTVTIMFSDIEGSTAMADRLGDTKFMEVLREHNAIIRDQIKAHAGFEVKSEGDGFMVAFQSAGKALACASAIQKALTERNGAAEEPVKVRMGLHAGEVIKEGEDFFGRNVIMAARVASQAHGGEILASGVVKALVAGSDVTWGELADRGTKGLVRRPRNLGGEVEHVVVDGVNALEREAQGRAATTLERAFMPDPMFKWILPNPEKRSQALHRLIRVPLEYGLRYGRVTQSDGGKAIAIWIPPERPMSMPGMVRSGFLALPFRIGFGPFFKFMGANQRMEKIHKKYMPEPHLYLLIVGVDPELQGKGRGSALVAEGLALADEANAPCYLDTSEERNLAFYERLGFKVVETASLGKDGPPGWGMRRESARSN